MPILRLRDPRYLSSDDDAGNTDSGDDAGWGADDGWGAGDSPEDDDDDDSDPEITINIGRTPAAKTRKDSKPDDPDPDPEHLRETPPKKKAGMSLGKKKATPPRKPATPPAEPVAEDEPSPPPKAAKPKKKGLSLSGKAKLIKKSKGAKENAEAPRVATPPKKLAPVAANPKT